MVFFIIHRRLSRHGKLLAPHILLIHPENRKQILQSNSVLFFNETTLLVDTGSQVQNGKLREIKNIVEINHILFSHYHIDHIIGSHIFPNTEKLIHEQEKDALLSLNAYFHYCSQNRNDTLELKGEWSQRLLSFLNREGFSSWEDLNLMDVQSVDSNALFDIGVTEIQLIHLPGHSPGHIGLYDPLSRILFIGDMEISSSFGPWYGWPNSDLQAFRKSVDRVLEFVNKHKISRIISSHFHEVTKEEGLKLLGSFSKSFDFRKREILEFIESHEQGVTVQQIADQSFIYKGKRSNPAFVWDYFEAIHIEQHIKELRDLNQIQIEGKFVKKL